MRCDRMRKNRSPDSENCKRQDARATGYLASENNKPQEVMQWRLRVFFHPIGSFPKISA